MGELTRALKAADPGSTKLQAGGLRDEFASLADSIVRIFKYRSKQQEQSALLEGVYSGLVFGPFTEAL